MSNLIDLYILETLNNNFSFKKILNEIDMQTIQKHLSKTRSLPFENIFNGKLRINIPIVDYHYSELEKIMRIEGYDVDFANKKAYIIKKTKDGKDNKVQLRLGKAINELIRKKEKSGEDSESLEKLKRLYKTYAEESDNYASYQESGGDSEYTIILSRAPVDVLRMSDFIDEWDSCHTKGKSFFHCAVQEAQTGGAIAYLVNREDIEGIDLQAPEIFRDDERGIDGITPVGRIRVRNIEDTKRAINLAIPETRMYGEDPGAFRDSLTNFLRKSQPEIFSQELPDPEDLILRGGGYTDNQPSQIINNFIGKVIYHPGSIEAERDSKDKTDAYGIRIMGGSPEDIANGMVEDIQEYINNSHDKFYTFYVDSDYIDEDTWYVSVRIGFYIELPPDIAEVLNDLDYRTKNQIVEEALEIFGVNAISNIDISDNGIYGSIDDSDSYESVGPDHEGDTYSLKSNTIDYYDGSDLDPKDFIKILRNILIREEYIEQELPFDLEDLENELDNLEIYVDDNVSEDSFGFVFAEVQVANLAQIKDYQARAEVKKIANSQKFTEIYFNNIVSRFSPNIKQLILPYVEMEPSVPISVPSSAALEEINGKYSIQVAFNLQKDNAEDFINFLKVINSHVKSLADMFADLVQEFLRKELFEINLKLRNKYY